MIKLTIHKGNWVYKWTLTVNYLWILVIPIGIIDVSTSRKCFLILFQFFTQLLTSKHLKLFSTYLVGRNGTKWNLWFSAPKNAKKVNNLKHKNESVTDFLLTVRSSSMMDYTFHYVVITLKAIVYINFNKKNENLEIYFIQVTGYLNTRKSFPICMFVVVASGIVTFIYISLFYNDSNLQHTKEFNIIFA